MPRTRNARWQARPMRRLDHPYPCGCRECWPPKPVVSMAFAMSMTADDLMVLDPEQRAAVMAGVQRLTEAQYPGRQP